MKLIYGNFRRNLLLFVAVPAVAVAFGDRGNDVDQRYPDDTLVQNGGPIYDVRRPPEGCRPAKGDGKTDDTEALRDAFDYLKKVHLQGYRAGASNLHVYLPNGTYLVSGPIFYRGDVALDGENQPRRHDILRVRIIGQSRARTVIRLVDKSPAFSDAAKPQVLLSFQHPKTTFNDAPGYNVLRNLIIDTGNGNPGAIAVRFQGAKRTDLRNVTIRSSDGAGVCGLWMPSGAMQGCVMDTSIVGFDYGIHITKLNEPQEMTPAFEHVALFSQRKAGLRIENGGTAIRRLRCDQSQTGATAIEVAGDGVQLVLIESALVGREGSPAAVVLTQKERQCLYVRDLVLGGYRVAIQQAERQPVAGPRVVEYLNYPPIVAVPGTPARSLRLEIKDAPVIPTFPPEQWANVNSFGAKGDGQTEDSEAIQKAFLSGKPVIYFPSSAYVITNSIRVPATVQRIELLGASIIRESWAKERVAFDVAEKSQQPILITDSGNWVPIGIRAPRTVVVRHMSGTVHTWTQPSVETFLENCAYVGHYQSFCIKGQKTWARGVNNETGAGSHFVCNGGTLWILGFKTQHIYCPAFDVQNGGRLEVLGGGANVIQGDLTIAPMIVVKDSEASVTMFTDATGPFGNIVEGRKGQNITIRQDQFPRRFANQPHSLFIPLYVAPKP